MTLYRIPTRVAKLEERFVQEHTGGTGDTATFKTVSSGWWLTLEGHLSFNLGPEKPPFELGDPIRITLEKP